MCIVHSGKRKYYILLLDSSYAWNMVCFFYLFTLFNLKIILKNVTIGMGIFNATVKVPGKKTKIKLKSVVVVVKRSQNTHR